MRVHEACKHPSYLQKPAFIFRPTLGHERNRQLPSQDRGPPLRPHGVAGLSCNNLCFPTVVGRMSSRGVLTFLYQRLFLGRITRES